VLPVAASATATTAAAAASAAATTTTAIAAASATAATATASTASATTAAFALRARFIDYDLAAFEILSVERGYGFFGLTVVADFNETESARLSRKAIADQCN